MEEITTANIEKFLLRFYDFYDGIIRNITFSFNRNSKPYAMITISVRDREENRDEGWVNIIFEIDEVDEIILLEGKITCSVLSWGTKVAFFDGKIYLDFCPYTEAPDDIEDFKKSRFLVVGRRCSLSVLPYAE